MIATYRCKLTEQLANGEPPKCFCAIAKVASRKLDMLAAATTLDDLRRPPANHLEALKGDRAGQHSIRINDQWRLCFVWRNGQAYEVEIVDYH